MLDVFIDPIFSRPDAGDGGIRRVVEAQVRHLSKYGIRVADNPDEAAVIANHGSHNTQRPGVPSVSHNHGLYWSRYDWPDWGHEANRQVIHAMSCSVAYTCPSEWVATSLRRGMLINPEIIYHGVEANDFGPSDEPGNYVLWNKARQDPVSDSQDMFRVARLLRHLPFVSTIGNTDRNVKVTGKMPYDQMQQVVRRAGVYLATARETFGIGTLEALASGVPVAGWDWGGQSEIILQGETGYLAPPGDFTALATAIEQCFADRENLSKNAIEDARERWTWEPRIAQYAEFYKKVAGYYAKKRPKVSVLVTCHNLARFLNAALLSVQKQTLEDWECIVVDDASTDETETIAREWEARDGRFKYVRPEKNLGLSMARNFAFSHASGRYVIPLDADDMFDEHALALLSDALDSDNCLHVAYGHLDTVNDAGDDRKRNDWPPEQYSWRQQMAHLNQLPYSAMMRREVFERSGGYRKRSWRAEDAAMWCQISSLGFRIKKVTQRSTLIYRWRSDSKTQAEVKTSTARGELQADGDWTAWYPWRLAGGHREARQKWPELKKGGVPQPHLVPFGVQGKPPPSMKFWDVHDYSYPNVSVIIPVGPGHEKYVIDALESLVAQDYPDWEAIVVNDTGKKWKDDFSSPVCGAPYAQVVETTDNNGVAHARNLGASMAKGEALVFLDADDYLMPGALKKFMIHYEEYDGIIYSDWMKNAQDDDGLKYYKVWEFGCGDVLKRMQHAGSSILVPRKVHEKIGGWDEEIEGWEDWDYLIAAQAIAECCSYYIPEALFVYRISAGSRREESFDNREHLLQYIRNKWSDYYEGRKNIVCGCKGKKKALAAQPDSLLSSSGNFQSEAQPGEMAGLAAGSMVMLEYNGPHIGPVTILGKETAKRYRFGQLEAHKRGYVYVADAEFMLASSKRGQPEFILVEQTPAPEESTDLEQIVDGELRPDFPVMEFA